MDLVFCIDYSSSIAADFTKVRPMILDIILRAMLSQPLDTRLALVKFRSATDAWRTRVDGFTRDRDEFVGWLDGVERDGGSRDSWEAVGDALQEAWNLLLGGNRGDTPSGKKLVVLVVDGAPNGLFSTLDGPDPWVVATRFLREHITLAVVGVEPSVGECEDFYCALAEKTGGQYIPLVNASRLLSWTVQRVIQQDLTFQQAFRGVDKYDVQTGALICFSTIQSRIDGMVKDCVTMEDIRNQYFSYYKINSE